MLDDDPGYLAELLPEYDIIDKHDGGAQASVYMAAHRNTARTVALKVLTRSPIAHPQYRERFMSEIDMISRLHHANIVTLYDYGEVDGFPYYAMHHVLGMPITDYVFFNEYGIRQCVELLLPVLDAVAYAHTLGIVHRDIKPSNIIVDDAGQPFLLDFGLGRFLSHHERSQALFATGEHCIVGTVPYMSPEQARGQIVDVRSDVYSLAVVLYEMISDELPYRLEGSKEQLLHTIMNGDVIRLPSRLSRPR